MSERRRDRWLSILFSLALHALIAAAFVYGWMLWKHSPPPARVLAIDATVVDSRTLNRETRSAVVPTPPKPIAEPEPTPARTPEPKPVPAPQPPLPAPLPAPRVKPVTPPVPQDTQVRREARQDALAAAAAHEAAAQKAAAEKAAATKAAAEAAAEAKAKADAESRARAERERAATEADLRRRMAEEERVTAAQASGLQDRWVTQIQARIQSAWIRPPSAKQGLDCTVQVTQVPGGEVVSVRVTSCNGDEVVRQSIEAAVLRASPLPAPPDPALFVRNLEVRFRPNE